MTAALRDWLRSMDLLGSAKTSSSVLPPFGVELVHSEGVRSRSFAGTYWDPSPELLDVLDDRRARGLWTPARTMFEAGPEAPLLADVPLPGFGPS